jgi:hypothetical protein
MSICELFEMNEQISQRSIASGLKRKLITKERRIVNGRKLINHFIRVYRGLRDERLMEGGGGKWWEFEICTLRLQSAFVVRDAYEVFKIVKM